MGIPRATIERMLANTGRPAPVKSRARVGTGSTAKRKQWECKMATEGGGIFLPLVTKSESNMRDRWATISRTEAAHLAIPLALREFYRGVLPPLPATITITRYSTRLLDEHDNLKSSQKAVVDAIAKEYGVDDGDKSKFDWQYKQEKGVSYGIRIEINPREAR